MMKPRGLGLSRGAPMSRAPMDDMEDMGGEYGGEEAMASDDQYWRHPQDPMDPPPRRRTPPADQGGPDFDPTDPRQKPKGYDRYTQDAAAEAERIRDEVPDTEAGRVMQEWRRRWLQRAKAAGLDERHASQALDDIEDGL